ncbi:MAG: aldehyde ferredoxin oxidoreductase N-terminal domain-containing protein [Candidatus Bathyarchaeia archaeon]
MGMGSKGSSYGWVGHILRVDLSSGRIWSQDTMRYAPAYLGGRGIAARIAWEELKPGIDAFDPENRLIFMTGPLTGTLAPSSGRIEVCGAAPQAYPRTHYTRSNMGGWFGSELKYAGFDGIVIQGASDRPVYLWIEDGRAEILDAKELWGRDTFSTQKYLLDRHDRNAQIACIGPAGENLVRYAVVQSRTENAAGQGGFGAVMGSKKLKAIAVRGTGGVRIAEPGRFFDLCTATNRALRTARGRPPTGSRDPEMARKYGARSAACSQACPMDCGIVYTNVPGRVNRGIQTTRVQCVAPLFGGAERFYDWKIGREAGTELSALANKLGLNHWVLLLGVVPWLRECHRRGLIKFLDGEPIDFDSPRFWANLLEKISQREGIGNILAEDVPRASEILKIGEDVMKSLYPAYGFPGHWDGHGDKVNPAFFPLWIVSALQWFTDTRDPFSSGHGYTSWLASWSRILPWDRLAGVGEKVYGSRKSIDPSYPYEYKAQPAIWEQNESVLKDSLPLCDNLFPFLYTTQTEDNYARVTLSSGEVIEGKSIGYHLFQAATGLKLDEVEFRRCAERVFNLERAIDVRNYSRRREDDLKIIPYFETPENIIGPSGKLESLDKKAFLKLVDEYYLLRGWDLETGIPTKRKLDELGLQDVAEELYRSLS